MELVIGCPIKDRAWVLNAWIDAALISFYKADVDPFFAFVTGPSSDETNQIIENRLSGRFVSIESTQDVPLGEGEHRFWGPERMNSIVSHRNQLLGLVRELQPDRFLSLDSDILLHPRTVNNLLETSDMYDAVGGRCFMSPVRKVSSYGKLDDSRDFKRGTDGDGVFPVGVIMAIKMMNPYAYEVDYSFHKDGEDISWSRSCRENGLSLGWDGRNINKHVLNRFMLEQVDERVGF
jgi:hypothetical protein